MEVERFSALRIHLFTVQPSRFTTHDSSLSRRPGQVRDVLAVHADAHLPEGAAGVRGTLQREPELLGARPHSLGGVRADFRQQRYQAAGNVDRLETPTGHVGESLAEI